MSLDEEFKKIYIEYDKECMTSNRKDILVKFYPFFEKYEHVALSVPFLKSVLFHFFANYYSEIEIDYEKAIDYLKKSLLEIENIDKEKLIANNLSQPINETLKYISIFSKKLGNNKNSDQLYWLKQYAYYNFAFISNTKKKVLNHTLYSYRRINDYLLKDLTNREITVSAPKMFNDPIDCPLFTIFDKVNNSKEAEEHNPLKNAYGFMKIRCFVSNRSVRTGDLKQAKPQKEEYKNILMWSHYADSHKGICIRYKLNRNFLEFNHKLQVGSDLMNVEYKEEHFINSSINSIDEKIAFATKNKCWSYENEVRLLHYDPNCNSPFKALPLGDKGNIEAIYFGIQCPEKDIDTIKAILGDHVAYFKMKVDDEDLFKLVEMPLNDKAKAMLEAASEVVAEIVE